MEYVVTAKEFLLSPGSLWFVWVLALLVFIGVSAVFLYHWKPHFTHSPAIKRAAIVYSIGGGLILIAAMLCALFF